MTVVAVLALLLGVAVGALGWSVVDDGDDPAAAPTSSTTPSTTTTTTPGRGGTSSTTSTTGTVPPGGDNDNGTGGKSSVGNSSFSATYQSDQDQSTATFTVADDWTIRWEVVGGPVVIEVVAADGQPVRRIDAQGQGQADIAEGGTYRLDITAGAGRYTVVVTDGP